jgi:hypothetical protein
MIKFLLTLPLIIFLAFEAFIIYMLGNVMFTAANESAAVLIGNWNFWQIALAVAGVIVGIVLSTFLYITVVLKPVYYPPPEDEKPVNYKKQQRSRHVEPDHPKSKKKLVIALIIIGVIVVLLGVAGFLFRETVFDFVESVFSRFTGSDEEDEEDYSIDEPETEAEPEPEPEPEIPANASFTIEDPNYRLQIFYPDSLGGEPVTGPIEPGLFREASDIEPQLLLDWNANENGYTAADYALADPAGIIGTGERVQNLDDNTIICRIDGENMDGASYSSVRFWYIDEDAVVSADISCETPEMADDWYARLEAGEIHIEKMPVQEAEPTDEAAEPDNTPEDIANNAE